MGATTAVSFCKYTEVTACAWCKHQCSAELRSRITEEFSHSAGGPNELGWARPSFSENPQNLYYPLGSSSTTAEMCKKTPLFCLSTVPTCLLDFFLDRHSFFPLAALAEVHLTFFFARFARGQTINTTRFPKNLKVSVRPAPKNFKNGREKKRKKTKINLGFSAFLAKIRIYPGGEGGGEEMQFLPFHLFFTTYREERATTSLLPCNTVITPVLAGFNTVVLNSLR